MIPLPSGPEEHKPDDAQDQDREPGRSRKQRQHRRPWLGLRASVAVSTIRLVSVWLPWWPHFQTLRLARHRTVEKQRVVRNDVPACSGGNFEAKSGKKQTRGRTTRAARLTPLGDSSAPLALNPGSRMVSSCCRLLRFGVSHGPPRQLEGLFAPFARDLPGRAVSGHVGYRKGLASTRSTARPAIASNTPRSTPRPARKWPPKTSSRATRSTPTPTSR